MIRIAVCDDVPNFVERLTLRIRSWEALRSQNVQIETFFSGEELLMEIEESGDFHAVFLDVELGGVNGIEVAKKLMVHNRLISIVFVTQYSFYMRQIIRFYPVHYLEKPVAEQRVHEVLDQIVKMHHCVHETYSFEAGHAYTTIPQHSILYFSSEGRRINICMNDGKVYTHYGKLNAIEKKLRPSVNPFLRIHQSYLVNAKQIERFYREYVIMSNSELLPVSRGRREEVEQYHMESLRNGGNYILSSK